MIEYQNHVYLYIGIVIHTFYSFGNPRREIIRDQLDSESTESPKSQIDVLQQEYIKNTILDTAMLPESSTQLYY